MGLAGFGFVLLGLGLTGLFYPSVILGAGLALVAGSRGTWKCPSILAAAAARAGAVGAPGLIAVSAALACLLPALLTPEFEVDCELYHLGMPWQWLQVHKSLPDHFTYGFHLSLPIDLSWAIALLLGDDRIAKWLAAGAFLATSAFWAGRCLEAGRPRAAWTGTLLAFSAVPVVWLAGTCKNDVPAAALFVCGALLQASGAWGLGAAFLGLGAAAKYTLVPLVVVWVVFRRPPRAVWGRCAAALVVPPAVWMIKTWLMTGSPSYPFAAGIFPAYDWNEANQKAFLDYAATLYDPAAGRLSTLPGTWFRTMCQDHLLLFLALPGFLLFGRRRATAWVLVAGGVAVLAAGRFPRYILPSAWMLALLAAESFETGPEARRRMIAWLLAAAALGRVWPQALAAADRRDILEPRAQVLARHLTTRGRMLDALSALKPPASGAPFKVLNIGEFRSYRFPARVIAGGALGETPLIWEMVRASTGLRDLRARFRQLGARVLVYDCVSVSWLAPRYRPFPWDRRMAGLYAAFCRRYLEIAAAPDLVDYENGGFYLYRILDRPRIPGPATVFFVPGAESILGDHLQFTDITPDPRRALDSAFAALGWLPEVLWVRNRVGHACVVMDDLPGAVRYLRPGVEAGMIDELNLVDYASAVTSLGRLDEAARVLNLAFQRCPSHLTFLRIVRANWYAHHSRTFLGSKDWTPAVQDLEQGLGVLALIPPGAGPQFAVTRRDVEIDLKAVLGEVRIAQGRRAEGARLLREAIALDPAGPWVARWRSLADAASGSLLP